MGPSASLGHGAKREEAQPQASYLLEGTVLVHLDGAGADEDIGARGEEQGEAGRRRPPARARPLMARDALSPRPRPPRVTPALAQHQLRAGQTTGQPRAAGHAGWQS